MLKTKPSLNPSARSMANTVSLAMGIQVAGVALGYALQVILARWLGSAEYGVYASIQAWATALSVIASGGLTMSALRFIPEYTAKGEWGRAAGFVRFGYLLSIGFSVLLAVLCATACAVLRHRHDSMLTVLLCCCWLTPLMTVLDVQSKLCRGFKWIVTSMGFPLILLPVLSGLTCGLVTKWTRLTAVSACRSVGIAFAIAIAFQFVLLIKRRPIEVREASCIYDVRAWIRVSAPLWIICGFYIVLNQLDILMVALRLGERAAGLYNAATASSAFVALGLVAVNSIAAPTYASLYAEGKIADMQRLASRAAHWISWPAILVLAVLCVFGHAIMRAFGGGFGEAYASTVILGLGQLFNAGCGSVGYLLGLTGHQNQSSRVLGWAALTNIALNLVGITFLGVEGAAIGTAVSMAMWNLWLYRLVVRHLGVRPSIVDALVPSRDFELSRKASRE